MWFHTPSLLMNPHLPHQSEKQIINLGWAQRFHLALPFFSFGLQRWAAIEQIKAPSTTTLLVWAPLTGTGMKKLVPTNSSNDRLT